MIKGLQKCVVVVKTPSPEIFEEAIFVIKDSYIRKANGSQKEVMRQAEKEAEKLAASIIGDMERGRCKSRKG